MLLIILCVSRGFANAQRCQKPRGFIGLQCHILFQYLSQWHPLRWHQRISGRNLNLFFSCPICPIDRLQRSDSMKKVAMRFFLMNSLWRLRRRLVTPCRSGLPTSIHVFHSFVFNRTDPPQLGHISGYIALRTRWAGHRGDKNCHIPLTPFSSDY